MTPEAGAANGPFVSAVEAIYACAATPSKWPQALQAIADVFGDAGTVLLWRRDDGSIGTIVSPKLAAAEADFHKGWWRHDFRTFRALEHGYLRSQEVLTDRHVATQEEIDAHPIYTQFLVPHGLGWFAGAPISPDPLIEVWVSVQRAKARTPFSEAELETVGRLCRHAEQALRLSIRLFDAEVSKLGLSESLARIGTGVFALDSQKRVVFANRAAERLLGDGLIMTKSRFLQALSEQGALNAAIERMIRGAPEEISAMPKPILVGRRKSAWPLAVYVLPITDHGLDHAAAQFLTQTRAIVLAIDPGAGAPADPALVRDLLGLTLGEARVAALVGSGLTPRAAAQRLGIAEGTARDVLKRAFAKSGISRQSELTALLTRLVLR